MRRLTALLVALALCGTLLTLGTIAAVLSPGSCLHRHMRRPARALASLVPTAVQAQEHMRFQPVPAESVRDVAKRPRRGARAVTPMPAPATAPAPETTATVPPVPDNGDESTTGEFGRRSSHAGDMVRFGSSIHVRAGQSVHGDVVSMGGDVTVDGHVDGDVVSIGGDVRLGPGGSVDGQVVTVGGQLHEAPGSHVSGSRVTAGGLPRRWVGWPFFGVMSSGIKIVIDFCKMLFALLIAWGFTQLAPNRSRAAVDYLRTEPLMAFGIGLLAWALVIPSVVAMALVVAILCITIIGIPLALAVVLGYVLGLLLLAVWGFVVGTVVLGGRIAHQLGRAAATLTMMAVWGIISLTVVSAVGHMFGALPMGGPPGFLLVMIAKVLSAVLLTAGAGAILRMQLRRESMSQWWPPGRRAAMATPGMGTPVAPVTPAMPATPVTQVAPPPPAAPMSPPETPTG
ncbi:MAG: polymer-forming cytoskeletal protein [Candidatus Eisenbacteria bacterium]|nr:polymer-forming cytoskeletal protein [Candidatus Eisenbacteria bacterium]